MVPTDQPLNADIDDVGEAEFLIPEEVLLDTPSFPSALQVFAGVGGLALLAEHLPLLYPEVTRQVTPADLCKDSGGLGLAHDWVTVESNEDWYEVRRHIFLDFTFSAEIAHI